MANSSKISAICEWQVGNVFLRLTKQVSVLTRSRAECAKTDCFPGDALWPMQCRALYASPSCYISRLTLHGFREWRSLAVAVLFVHRSCVALALRAYRQANILLRDGFSATVAADNGAFEVGRPACIGPTTSQQQVLNRTALDGSM